MSSPAQIDNFIAEARVGGEEIVDDFVEAHEADWRLAEPSWQASQDEQLGGDEPLDSAEEARQREDIEIARIATRFGRGSSRRNRKTQS